MMDAQKDFLIDLCLVFMLVVVAMIASSAMGNQPPHWFVSLFD